MKKLVLLIMIMCFALHGKATNYADYVNPLIGTQSTYEFSSGNTYPAIARPWGMNFWTPQTGKMGDGWQYMYTATKIRGFKQTHQPSPWINDYGQFSIMPVVGEPVLKTNVPAGFRIKVKKQRHIIIRYIWQNMM
jgi:putative alpha-1,2-mannosidase